MISIILETYGVPNMSQRTRVHPPRRPLPSLYFRKPVRPHNPTDLRDDAPGFKKVHRQHVVSAKSHTSVGFKPDPGQQLTKKH